MKRRARGFSLLEVVFTMTIFGVFLIMLVTMTSEMRRMEKKYKLNFSRHPQVIAMLSRLRKDVLDGVGKNPYPYSHDVYTQSPTILIVYTLRNTGYAETVVWDFSKAGEARRISYGAGTLKTGEWIARGLPELEIATFEIPGRSYSVRIKSKGSGKGEIDQILQPRPHD
ncbi:MAG: prepilin-type N-terminal cleavage/methylation domain-containing protein [Thermoanaerobaculia bacterium]|nr:prepilin-type N-terminal cleavage/methylation domain-containing protein [Thermoanaerobaculia bacterium]